jgi:hypothetical protein
MYLIPRLAYSKLIDNAAQSSTTAAVHIRQLNNLEVGSGGKVTVNNEDKVTNRSIHRKTSPDEGFSIIQGDDLPPKNPSKPSKSSFNLPETDDVGQLRETRFGLRGQDLQISRNVLASNAKNPPSATERIDPSGNVEGLNLVTSVPSRDVEGLNSVNSATIQPDDTYYWDKSGDTFQSPPPPSSRRRSSHVESNLSTDEEEPLSDNYIPFHQPSPSSSSSNNTNHSSSSSTTGSVIGGTRRYFPDHEPSPFETPPASLPNSRRQSQDYDTDPSLILPPNLEETVRLERTASDIINEARYFATTPNDTDTEEEEQEVANHWMVPGSPSADVGEDASVFSPMITHHLPLREALVGEVERREMAANTAIANSRNEANASISNLDQVIPPKATDVAPAPISNLAPLKLPQIDERSLKRHLAPPDRGMKRKMMDVSEGVQRVAVAEATKKSKAIPSSQQKRFTNVSKPPDIIKTAVIAQQLPYQRPKAPFIPPSVVRTADLVQYQPPPPSKPKSRSRVAFNETVNVNPIPYSGNDQSWTVKKTVTKKRKKTNGRRKSNKVLRKQTLKRSRPTRVKVTKAAKAKAAVWLMNDVGITTKFKRGPRGHQRHVIKALESALPTSDLPTAVPSGEGGASNKKRLKVVKIKILPPKKKRLTRRELAEKHAARILKQQTEMMLESANDSRDVQHNSNNNVELRKRKKKAPNKYSPPPIPNSKSKKKPQRKRAASDIYPILLEDSIEKKIKFNRGDKRKDSPVVVPDQVVKRFQPHINYRVPHIILDHVL